MIIVNCDNCSCLLIEKLALEKKKVSKKVRKYLVDIFSL